MVSSGGQLCVSGFFPLCPRRCFWLAISRSLLAGQRLREGPVGFLHSSFPGLELVNLWPESSEGNSWSPELLITRQATLNW